MNPQCPEYAIECNCVTIKSQCPEYPIECNCVTLDSQCPEYPIECNGVTLDSQCPEYPIECNFVTKSQCPEYPLRLVLCRDQKWHWMPSSYHGLGFNHITSFLRKSESWFCYITILWNEGNGGLQSKDGKPIDTQYFLNSPFTAHMRTWFFFFFYLLLFFPNFVM
jgi:hypothetical protein